MRKDGFCDRGRAGFIGVVCVHRSLSRLRVRVCAWEVDTGGASKSARRRQSATTTTMRAASLSASASASAAYTARRRRRSCRAYASTSQPTTRRVALVVMDDDDDDDDDDDATFAHPEIVAAAIRTLPDVQCDVLASTSSSSSSYDARIVVTRRRRAEDEEFAPQFTVSVLATSRSKKHPCVALEPVTSSETLASSRAFNDGVRLCAERAFLEEADVYADDDYATYAGVLEPCRTTTNDDDDDDDDVIDLVHNIDDDDDDDDNDATTTTTTTTTRDRHRIRLTRLDPRLTRLALERLLLSGAKCGLPIELVIEHVVRNSMHRSGVSGMKKMSPPVTGGAAQAQEDKMKVYVVFGGSSSQRRQSCRSGRHVYLTLKRIPTIDVVAVVLSNNNTNTNNASSSQLADATAWRLSYASALDPDQWDAPRAPDAGRFAPSKRVRADLEKYGWVKPSELSSCQDTMMHHHNEQRSTRFGALLAVASREGAIIFNAAHGGAGEDGALQQLCVSSGVAYTGSSPLASRVCMDKAATAKALAQRPVHGATCLPKRVVPASALVSKASDERGWGGRERVEGAKRLWLDIVSSFSGGGAGGAAPGAPGDTNTMTTTTTTLVVKPIAEGASRGVRRLMDERELLAYAEDIAKNQASPLPYAYVFEPFFDASRAPWMECSFTLMGALGDLRVVGQSTIDARAKERARAVGHALGVEGCAVLDAFVNTDTGELIVIEMNTVPDMTSPDSTAFTHARNADPPIDAETLCTRALSLALVRRFR